MKKNSKILLYLSLCLLLIPLSACGDSKKYKGSEVKAMVDKYLGISENDRQNFDLRRYLDNGESFYLSVSEDNHFTGKYDLSNWFVNSNGLCSSSYETEIEAFTYNGKYYFDGNAISEEEYYNKLSIENTAISVLYNEMGDDREFEVITNRDDEFAFTSVYQSGVQSMYVRFTSYGELKIEVPDDIYYTWSIIPNFEEHKGLANSAIEAIETLKSQYSAKLVDSLGENKYWGHYLSDAEVLYGLFLSEDSHLTKTIIDGYTVQKLKENQYHIETPEGKEYLGNQLRATWNGKVMFEVQELCDFSQGKGVLPFKTTIEVPYFEYLRGFDLENAKVEDSAITIGDGNYRLAQLAYAEASDLQFDEQSNFINHYNEEEYFTPLANLLMSFKEDGCQLKYFGYSDGELLYYNDTNILYSSKGNGNIVAKKSNDGVLLHCDNYELGHENRYFKIDDSIDVSPLFGEGLIQIDGCLDISNYEISEEGLIIGNYIITELDVESKKIAFKRNNNDIEYVLSAVDKNDAPSIEDFTSDKDYIHFSMKDMSFYKTTMGENFETLRLTNVLAIVDKRDGKIYVVDDNDQIHEVDVTNESRNNNKKVYYDKLSEIEDGLKEEILAAHNAQVVYGVELVCKAGIRTENYTVLYFDFGNGSQIEPNKYEHHIITNAYVKDDVSGEYSIINSLGKPADNNTSSYIEDKSSLEYASAYFDEFIVKNSPIKLNCNINGGMKRTYEFTMDSNTMYINDGVAIYDGESYKSIASGYNGFFFYSPVSNGDEGLLDFVKALISNKEKYISLDNLYFGTNNSRSNYAIDDSKVAEFGLKDVVVTIDCATIEIHGYNSIDERIYCDFSYNSVISKDFKEFEYDESSSISGFVAKLSEKDLKVNAYGTSYEVYQNGYKEDGKQVVGNSYVADGWMLKEAIDPNTPAPIKEVNYIKKEASKLSWAFDREVIGNSIYNDRVYKASVGNNEYGISSIEFTVSYSNGSSSLFGFDVIHNDGSITNYEIGFKDSLTNVSSYNAPADFDQFGAFFNAVSKNNFTSIATSEAGDIKNESYNFYTQEVSHSYTIQSILGKETKTDNYYIDNVNNLIYVYEMVDAVFDMSAPGYMRYIYEWRKYDVDEYSASGSESTNILNLEQLNNPSSYVRDESDPNKYIYIGDAIITETEVDYNGSKAISRVTMEIQYIEFREDGIYYVMKSSTDFIVGGNSISHTETTSGIRYYDFGSTNTPNIPAELVSLPLSTQAK